VTFVERIGGDEVDVFELVPPGASPATYELVPSQLSDLSEADVYFRIGHVPFEKANLARIEENNPDLKIVDTSEGIQLRELEEHSHGEEEHDHDGNEGEEGHSADEHGHEEGEHSELEEKCEEAGGNWLEEFGECENIESAKCSELGGEFDGCASPCRHQEDAEVCAQVCVEVCRLDEAKHSEADHQHEKGGDDPHIWLDPTLVKQQGEHILETLIDLRPEREDYFRDNYNQFAEDLDQLDSDLAETFEPFRGETMLVYHPAFGYLADRYGFEQEHFEIPGKELSPSEVQEIVDEAQEEDIRVVFVQKQFDTSNAELIASEINGQVVKIDPLAKDYFENLRNVANKIAESER
jgi:zinc transport system substrate-binding protein